MKHSRLLCLVLVLVLAVSTFVACDSIDGDTLALAYNKLIESCPTGTLSQPTFTLPACVEIGETKIVVQWTRSSSEIVIDQSESAVALGLVTVTTPTDNEQIINYTLTGTLVDGDGQAYVGADGLAYSITLNGVVPAHLTGKVYEPKAVDNLQANTPYKLAIKQNGRKEFLYAMGEMNGYYVASNTDYILGVDVYVEPTDGGYYLSFTQDGATKYYSAEISGTHNNILITDAKQTVWAIDSTTNVISTTLGSGDSAVQVYIGTYSSYNTFSLSAMSKLSATSYPAFLATMELVEGEGSFSEEHVCAHKCSVCGKCKDATCTDPVCSAKCTCGQQPELGSNSIIIANSIPGGWSYITNNEQYPEPSYYNSGALKFSYENCGILSPVFEAVTNNVSVKISISALNKNTKSSTAEHNFAVYGLDSTGAVVGTKYIDNVSASGDYTVTFSAPNAVQVKIIMVGYPQVSGTCQNVALSGVAVDPTGGEQFADPTSGTGTGEGGGTVTTTHQGTKEDPYTVAEAYQLANALGKDVMGTQKVYVTGYVAGLSFNSSHNSYTGYMSDDSTKKGDLQLYCGVLDDSAEVLKEGAQIVVYGYLKNYDARVMEIAFDESVEDSNPIVTVLTQGHDLEATQGITKQDSIYTLDLVSGFSTYASAWDNQYAYHKVDFAGADITASVNMKASHQTQTITDRPVTAAKSSNDGSVEFSVSGHKISSVTFNLQEWSASKKFKTMVIEYTTDGTNWVKTDAGFDGTAHAISEGYSALTASGLTDAVAVRLYLVGNSTSNNQIGLTSIVFELAD